MEVSSFFSLFLYSRIGGRHDEGGERVLVGTEIQILA